MLGGIIYVAQFTGPILSGIIASIGLIIPIATFSALVLYLITRIIGPKCSDHREALGAAYKSHIIVYIVFLILAFIIFIAFRYQIENILIKIVEWGKGIEIAIKYIIPILIPFLVYISVYTLNSIHSFIIVIIEKAILFFTGWGLIKLILINGWFSTVSDVGIEHLIMPIVKNHVSESSAGKIESALKVAVIGAEIGLQQNFNDLEIKDTNQFDELFKYIPKDSGMLISIKPQKLFKIFKSEDFSNINGLAKEIKSLEQQADSFGVDEKILPEKAILYFKDLKEIKSRNPESINAGFLLKSESTFKILDKFFQNIMKKQIKKDFSYKKNIIANKKCFILNSKSKYSSKKETTILTYLDKNIIFGTSKDNFKKSIYSLRKQSILRSKDFLNIKKNINSSSLFTWYLLDLQNLPSNPLKNNPLFKKNKSAIFSFDIINGSLIDATLCISFENNEDVKEIKNMLEESLKTLSNSKAKEVLKLIGITSNENVLLMNIKISISSILSLYKSMNKSGFIK